MAGHPAGTQLVNQVVAGRLDGGGTQRARCSSTPTGAASVVSPLSNRGKEVASDTGPGLAVTGVSSSACRPRDGPVKIRWLHRGSAGWSITDPLGPLTLAPIVEPCNTVTVPVSGPQVTWLEDMATPPLTESPLSVTTRGAAPDPTAVMVKTTETWPSRFGAEVW